MKNYSAIVTMLFLIAVTVVVCALLKIERQRVEMTSLAINLVQRADLHLRLCESLSGNDPNAAWNDVSQLIMADAYLATMAAGGDLPQSTKMVLYNVARKCCAQSEKSPLSEQPAVKHLAFGVNYIDWTSSETIENSIALRQRQNRNAREGREGIGKVGDTRASP